MQTKINILSIILIVIFVNATGLLLKYFKLDEYIIFAGFRFHLSLVIPFIFVIRKKHYSFLKELFLKPSYKRYIPILIWVLIPAVIVIPAIFILKKAVIADPYRFYELGLSSIIDYPIYLVWNFPQLFLFAAFLFLANKERKFKLLFSSILIILLFIYEFITLQNKTLINVNNIFYNYVPLIFSAIMIGMILKYFSNIYVFCITIFSTLWIYFLCFGSNSKVIVNLLFAANYDGWGGFFTPVKVISPFLFSGYMFLSIILVFLARGIKNKS